MPKRMAKHVSDMEIDEISLVDRPANQHALVTIAKRRAPEEDHMPDEQFFNEEGQAIDPDLLDFGDHVFDSEGNEYVLEEDDEDEPEYEEDREPVGVSKAFDNQDELSKSFLDELAKAVTETDKNEVIAKALARQAELSKRLAEAESLAASERTLRLQKDYISKAAEYNVPIEPEELGPVLMRMAETMSFDDCAVIHKALSAAGEMLFEEAGYEGTGDNDDPMHVVDQIISETVSKSGGQVDRAVATENFFENHPEAYDMYLQQQVRG